MDYPDGTLVVKIGAKVMPALIYCVVGRIRGIRSSQYLRIRDWLGNIHTVRADRYRRLSVLELLAFEAEE